MSNRRNRPFLALLGLCLVSCATIGPTVQVAAPAGKSPNALAEDRRACMASTDASLQPVATRMNLSAGNADEMAAGNARIQAMYDDAFGRCMSSRGDVVLASAAGAGVPQAGPPPGAPADGLREASDSASVEAERALKPVISQVRHDCEGEDIVPVATEMQPSTGGIVRLVTLTEPHGGTCFGEPGQNAYLLERRGGAWRLLLAAEPGSIAPLDSSRRGKADVELRSLGLCAYRYGWDGHSYRIVGSHDCALPAPPATGTLPGLIR